MEEKKRAVLLGVQVDSELRDKLDICAKYEKRTKRAVVELALEEYFKRSDAFKGAGGGDR